MGKSVFLLIAGLACVGAEALASDVSILATYSQSEIREKGDNVSLVLTIELVNRGGAEVHYGRLSLIAIEASASEGAPVQRLDFDRIFLQLNGSTKLSGSLILDRKKYNAEMAAVPLRASFEWFDDNAVPHAAELELREAPASQKR